MSRIIPLSTIARDYICAQCGAQLTIRDGRLYCVQDEKHFGWIKRRRIERLYQYLRAKDREVLLNPFFRQNIPGWPQPEPISTEKAMQELFE